MTNRERQLYLEYKKAHPWATVDYALRIAQALAFAEEGKMDWPQCMVCNKGVLLPLSDYGPEGALVLFKAWACNNHRCQFVLRIDKGQVSTEGKTNGG